jgi:hypothetical protein
VRLPSDRAFLKRTGARLLGLPRHVPMRNFFPRTAQCPSEPMALARSLVGLLAALALLLGFGWLVGDAAHIHHPRLLRSSIHTVTRPAVAGPIALALLVLCGRLLRGVRMAWLAWTPGPIVVPDFSMPRAVKGTTAEQLTASFRAQLGLLRLDTAKPSPGATPQGSFIDVLDSGTLSESDIMRTLLTLLRASWPVNALEVTGVIQERADPKGCGIAVQPVRLPGQPGGLVEVWESSWELATARAADGAVAALLPRTRLCRGPWASWQRFLPPRELLTAYREAGELIADRRYDEALARYREALERDPTNLTVALQLGQLQEKIGLFIGALTTYQRILALDKPDRLPLPNGLYRRRSRREWERSVLIAKYRQVVLLSQGSLVREWCGQFKDEPCHYRKDLRDHFKGELQPLTLHRHDPAADALASGIELLIEHRQSGGPAFVEEVQARLLPFAYKAGYELARSLWRLELNPWGKPLTRRTVGLTLATLRWRGRIRGEDGAGTKRPERLVRRLRRAALISGLRPWLWAGWAPPLPLRLTWQQHYNAACLYALPLALERDECEREHPEDEVLPLDTALRDKTTAALARLAVGRLERAASRADSAFVKTRRDWVLEEDLDLRGLRYHPEFRAFEAAYFPSRDDPAGLIFSRSQGQGQDQARERARLRLGSRARISQTDYAHELLGAVSARWHELWHRRSDHGGWLDPHALACWWSEELEIWRLYSSVVEHRFDWLLRKELLVTASERAVREGLEPVIARYRDQEEGREPTGQAEATPQGAHRFQSFKRAVSDGSGRDMLARYERQLEDCVYVLSLADAGAVDLSRHARIAQLCHAHAATWQTLEECLSGRLVDHDRAVELLRTRMDNVQALWRQAQDAAGRP